MVVPLLSRTLRLISLAFCLIAVAWFVAFAIEQSKRASAHQQIELNEAAPPSRAIAESNSRLSASQAPQSKHGTVREDIDKAFATLSSPFSSLTSSIGSQWLLHGVDTVLALLLYGFGLGYVARFVRVV